MTSGREMEGAMAKAAGMKQMRHVYKIVNSPVGKLTLVASTRGVAAILWENDRPGRVRLRVDAEDVNDPMLLAAERQLKEYFAGQRRTFDLPLDPIGTPFQRKVWNALLTIPFGETRTYGQIAMHIGHPSAARAVGAANGKNPLSIVAPCHRVIGSTGTLTGFAGGLDVKARLLAQESATTCGLPDGDAGVPPARRLLTVSPARVSAGRVTRPRREAGRTPQDPGPASTRLD
jgi:methylated-DNA-[protein]-cysteine S-methyltransferase